MKYTKKATFVIAIITMLLLLTACGNEIPSMSEQEDAMVAQYAANLVMQYSDKYQSKLVDTSSVEEAVVTENLQEDVEAADQTDLENQTDSEEVVIDDNSEDISINEAEDISVEEQNQQFDDESEPEQSALSIAQVLELDGFDVAYTGYEICDAYPNGDVSPENMFFAMNASNGSKLLVLHLQVTNTFADTAMLDTISSAAKYRVVLNGGHTQNTLVTMLENDFTALKREFTGTESFDAVIVAEVSQETADGLESVGLELRSGDRKTIVTN